jgi:hypothetical protein
VRYTRGLPLLRPKSAEDQLRYCKNKGVLFCFLFQRIVVELSHEFTSRKQYDEVFEFALQVFENLADCYAKHSHLGIVHVFQLLFCCRFVLIPLLAQYIHLHTMLLGIYSAVKINFVFSLNVSFRTQNL